MWGERLKCAIQPVASAILMIVSELTDSGLLTSRTTSPVASSQNKADTTTSLGNILDTIDLVSSSLSRIDWSVLTMNLFFKFLGLLLYSK